LFCFVLYSILNSSPDTSRPGSQATFLPLGPCLLVFSLLVCF
jgi:hypothetical protein